MAEPKKDAKKDDKKGGGGGSPVTLKDFIPFLITVFILVFVGRSVYSYLQDVWMQIGQAQDMGVETIYTQIFDFIATAVDWYIKIATIFSALAILGIAYAYMRLQQVKKMDKKKTAALSQKPAAKKSPESLKWQKVVEHVNSQNPAEWRLAILEADVLLEHLLESKGYHAETLGEKLKSAQAGDFKTIQAAWEAHKIRNSIAHQGADFLVSQREAKRVIDLYQSVFAEFGAL